MREFKIWNSFWLLPFIPIIFLLLCSCAISLLLSQNPSIIGNVFATFLFILAFAIPIFIILAARTEINYDGERILAKTFFGKREIILNDVQLVDFVYHEGTRSSKSYIELKLIYKAEPSEEDNHISLFDPLNISADMLIKGEYSEVNLLLLYRDIITRYPDKKVENAKINWKEI